MGCGASTAPKKHAEAQVAAATASPAAEAKPVVAASTASAPVKPQVEAKVEAKAPEPEPQPPPLVERLKHLLMPQIAHNSAFSMKEREQLGLEGMLPPVVETIEKRAKRWKDMLDEERDMLKKYQILAQLQSVDTTLFYKILVDHLFEFMPVVYVPTVGAACLKFDRLMRNSLGMYISFFQHRGKVRKVLDNWPFEVDIMVVTDGGRILGLGDLGTNGMGMAIGKTALYVAGGGFHPMHALPVQLDCGTDNQEYLQSDVYMGAKQPRVSAEEFSLFLEEFTLAVKDKWPRCLIQHEGLATARAIALLKTMQETSLCFNDDIQGTGAVILAGFISAMKAQGTDITESRVIFFGAGSTAVGVASQVVQLMVAEGLEHDQALARIYMFDAKGLLTATREQPLQDHHREFARADGVPDTTSLVEAINFVKPHALFGLSGAGPLFTQEVVEAMCCSTERPLIFPISNPQDRAEVTAENAYAWSDGKCIFAAGSPFAPVEHNGTTHVPGHSNNVFVFPGVGFGSWAVGATQVPDVFFIQAARELASYVSDDLLERGRIYPSIENLREISLNVAVRIGHCAFKMGLATVAQPEDMREYMAKLMYTPSYDAPGGVRTVNEANSTEWALRLQHLLLPQLARGTAFTEKERHDLGLDGLLPPVVEDLEQRKLRWKDMLEEESEKLKKYIIMSHLQAVDVTLFYNILLEGLVEFMPVVYTPTVCVACLKFDRIRRNHLGMYISYFEHRKRIATILKNWPFEVDLIVVTDGSRVLGLGDLGTNGMGIPIGKASLYVAGAGFHPVRTLPVQLDCGTDNKRLLESEFYLGHREPRIPLAEHLAFLEEFHVAVKERWPRCLIQHEGFSTERAFPLQHQLREKFLCFNDDIHGTGAVMLAGYINAMKIQGTPLKDAKALFFGAGSAAVGVATLLVGLLQQEGLSAQQARSRIYMFDSMGMVTTTREAGAAEHNREFARADGKEYSSLIDLITAEKPHALFGLSGAGPIWDIQVIRAMTFGVDRPLIFPLSNPSGKAEVSAENAYTWTNGMCIFAAGSAFPPVKYNKRLLVPGQATNAFVFPGVGFGCWAAQAKQVTDAMFIAASRVLADCVHPGQLIQGRIYPSVSNLRDISCQVAAKVAEVAFESRGSHMKKKPKKNMHEFVSTLMYSPSYDEMLIHI